MHRHISIMLYCSTDSRTNTQAYAYVLSYHIIMYDQYVETKHLHADMSYICIIIYMSCTCMSDIVTIGVIFTVDCTLCNERPHQRASVLSPVKCLSNKAAQKQTCSEACVFHCRYNSYDCYRGANTKIRVENNMIF